MGDDTPQNSGVSGPFTIAEEEASPVAAVSKTAIVRIGVPYAPALGGSARKITVLP